MHRSISSITLVQYIDVNMLELMIFVFFLLALQRYLVLANMLMESEVNPFDGQEAKP